MDRLSLLAHTLFLGFHNVLNAGSLYFSKANQEPQLVSYLDNQNRLGSKQNQKNHNDP